MDANVQERLDGLERQVAGLAARLAHVEGAVWPRPSVASTPPSGVASERDAYRHAGLRLPAPPGRQAVGPTFEELLGRHGLALAGAAAIVLGLGFFVVLAASRGWLSEPVRVVLAVLASDALIAIGARQIERDRARQASLAAVGTGIAGLFLAVAAATARYALLPTVPGLLAALAVAGIATALAVRWDARVIAGVGIVGGLAAPVLVDAQASPTVLAFLFVALGAAVAVLVWRRWDWLGLVALVVTVPQVLGWLFGEPPTVPALVVVAGLAGLLLAAAVGYEWRVPTADVRASSSLLVSLNALTAAAFGAGVLGTAAASGRWITGLAAVHGALALLAFRLRPARRGVGVVLLGAALALANLAWALLVSGSLLPVGWALAAAAIAVVARDGAPLRRAAIAGQLLLAAAHVLTNAAPPEALRDGTDALASAALALAALAVAGLAVRQPAIVVGALAYLVSVAIPTVVDGQQAQPVLSAFWAGTGLTALWLGLRRDIRSWRLAGFGALALAATKAVFYDLAALDVAYRAASFLALGVLLITGAFAYQRLRPAR